MLTCSKTFWDIPLAHRQHRHTGDCALIHGHNWTLQLTFACESFDDNGFVVDLGSLDYMKQWIRENLSHACALAVDDPLKSAIIDSARSAYKLYEVPNVSCEGIAAHLWEIFSELLYCKEGERVWITRVDLRENRKNAACFVPDAPMLAKTLRRRSS